jgi:sulfur relay (sulfurtransferase) DsrF/TusC family protein
MAESICLMLTESTNASALVRVLSLAAVAVDLHKRTVLYVGGGWIELARSDKYLEQRERDYQRNYKVSVMELFLHFQHAGGQLWVSSLSVQGLDLVKWPLIQGATVVDDQTLLTFLTQGTVVLNF